MPVLEPALGVLVSFIQQVSLDHGLQRAGLEIGGGVDIARAGGGRLDPVVAHGVVFAGRDALWRSFRRALAYLIRITTRIAESH